MIIYKSTNIKNKMSYIGQHIGFLSRRKYVHEWETFKSKRKHSYFHNAIRKYGKESFKWEVIENCDNKEELNEMEYHYIKQYNTKVPNGYNLTDGYDNTTYGFKYTKEQCLALSKRMKGKNNPNYGNGHKIAGDKNPAKRPEVRKKISEARKGKKRPDVAESKSKCYLIINLKTNEEKLIKNLCKFCRDTKYCRTGFKNVLSGEWKQYKGLWITKIN